jgi:cell division initiation protein
MRVSPLDIRKQEFTKTFRGYEIEEVNAFLQMVAREFEESRDDQRRLEEQIRGLEEKLRHYERVEEALQEALQTARDSSRKAVQNAEERARLIIRNAETKASEITHGAQATLEQMRAETSRLGNRQHEIVARLRAFLTAETEMLNRFERHELDAPTPSESRTRSSGPSVQRSTPDVAPGGTTRGAAPRQARSTEPDADDEPEDVFNPSAVEEESESQPIQSGAFNVRSLIARARDYEDEAEPRASDDDDLAEDPQLIADIVDEPEDEDMERASSSEPASGEAMRSRQATEEIEKIRRILNDLD